MQYSLRLLQLRETLAQNLENQRLEEQQRIMQDEVEEVSVSELRSGEPVVPGEKSEVSRTGMAIRDTCRFDPHAAARKFYPN